MMEVEGRLADNVEPRKITRWSIFGKREEKPYQGEVNGTRFKIERIIHYRNSFLPVITGQISTHLDKTVISVRMRPAISVLIFMSVWLGLMGAACVGELVVACAPFRQLMRHGISLAALIPFAMFLFGYGLVMISYRNEVTKSKDFLLHLLRAELCSE